MCVVFNIFRIINPLIVITLFTVKMVFNRFNVIYQIMDYNSK